MQTSIVSNALQFVDLISLQWSLSGWCLPPASKQSSQSCQETHRRQTDNIVQVRSTREMVVWLFCSIMLPQIPGQDFVERQYCTMLTKIIIMDKTKEWTTGRRFERCILSLCHGSTAVWDSRDESHCIELHGIAMDYKLSWLQDREYSAEDDVLHLRIHSLLRSAETSHSAQNNSAAI